MAHDLAGPGTSGKRRVDWNLHRLAERAVKAGLLDAGSRGYDITQGDPPRVEKPHASTTLCLQQISRPSAQGDAATAVHGVNATTRRIESRGPLSRVSRHPPAAPRFTS